MAGCGGGNGGGNNQIESEKPLAATASWQWRKSKSGVAGSGQTETVPLATAETDHPGWWNRLASAAGQFPDRQLTFRQPSMKIGGRETCRKERRRSWVGILCLGVVTWNIRHSLCLIIPWSLSPLLHLPPSILPLSHTFSPFPFCSQCPQALPPPCPLCTPSIPLPSRAGSGEEEK